MNKKQIIASLIFVLVGLSTPIILAPQEEKLLVIVIFGIAGLLMLIVTGVILFIDWLGDK